MQNEEREQRHIAQVNSSISKIMLKKMTNIQRQETVKEKRDKILQAEQKKKEFLLVQR